MAFRVINKTVAAAVTPELLSAIAGDRVSWATIQSLSTNTKPVEVHMSEDAGATFKRAYTINNPGDSYVLWSTARGDSFIDLHRIKIKVGADGEGVDVSATR